MKYANLIAATHFSSVGAAAFSEDSAFKDCQFAARHFHSAAPLAPPAVFFFFVFVFYLRAATFPRDARRRGKPGFPCDFLLLHLLLSKPIPNKTSFVFLSSFFSLSADANAGAADSAGHRVLHAVRPLRRPQPAARRPRHREHPAGQTPERKKIKMKKVFRRLSQESLSARDDAHFVFISSRCQLP